VAYFLKLGLGNFKIGIASLPAKTKPHVFKHPTSGFLTGLISPIMNMFHLEDMSNALSHSIIPTITIYHSCLFCIACQSFSKGPKRTEDMLLNTSFGMVDQSTSSTWIPDLASPEGLGKP
jgi:hypothetical protein